MSNHTTFTHKDVSLTYLSHSGFVITGPQAALAIDPFLTGNSLATKRPADINVSDIIVTHGHSDHLGDAVAIAQRNRCPITSTFHVARYVEAQGARSHQLPLGGTLTFPWGKVHLRAAMHSGFLPDGHDMGPAASALITIGELKIYHLGDTALIDDFKLVGEVYQPDIALVPIGGRFTMDIPEAVIATSWLQPKIVIPMHYNTFDVIQADPREFKSRVEAATSAACQIMEY